MWFSRAAALRIGLAPEGAALCRAGQAVTVQERAAAPAFERDWRPALAALGDLLAEERPAGARLSVALSHSLTRFLGVPWSDELLDGRRAQGYLGAQFSAVFGDASEQWVFAAEDLPHGQPRLACAVDGELLEALRQMAQAQGARIGSVTPWLVAAFNRAREDMATDGWFAAIEPGRLALVEVRSGGARQVALQNWQGDSAAAIERGVSRSALRAGGATGLPVRVADLSEDGGRTWLAAMAGGFQ